MTGNSDFFTSGDGGSATFFASCALLSVLSASCGAQSYPSKVVRIVVPVAAGGPTDILARAVAQKLTEAWNQQVVVDTRPGGGSNIGFELVAKSAPDGYTLLMAPGWGQQGREQAWRRGMGT
jgi:tripartite-type tricarboxylate transporter receptor subunit TctC